MKDSDPFVMIAIYDHPRDLPAGFVVREWHVLASVVTPVVEPLGADLPSLAAARALIPSGMINIGRRPEDDARIVEVWV